MAKPLEFCYWISVAIVRIGFTMPGYFLKIRNSSVNKILIKSIVVNGIQILKLVLLITMSPGSLPSGILLNQGQSNPTNTMISPM